MIAPAAFEDITFPQQALFPWSSYESNQYLRALNAYFTSGSGNDVVYGTPVEIGATLAGGVAKYIGGAMTPSGIIYSPGYLNTDWLLIDTNNDTVSVTGSLSGNHTSAFYSPYNRAVYASGTSRVSKITIDNNSGSFVSTPVTGQLPSFVLSYDGLAAYVTAIGTNRSIYKYDILIESASNLNIATTNDRYSACLAGNGKMYWTPSGPAGTRNYIEFDPATDTYTSFGTPAGDTQQGIIMAPDGFVYAFPFQANPVNRINPTTRAVTSMLTAGSTCRMAGVCIGADGNIYGCGVGNTLSIYNWRTNTLTTSATLPSTGGYQSIHMGVNGDLYLIPWSAPKVVKIPIINNGRVIRPIQEMNGILGRHQSAL